MNSEVANPSQRSEGLSSKSGSKSKSETVVEFLGELPGFLVCVDDMGWIGGGEGGDIIVSRDNVMDTVYLGQLQVVACWPSPNWGVAGVIMCCHKRVNRALWSSGQAGSILASSIFLCL
jgi:hypothetical protein